MGSLRDQPLTAPQLVAHAVICFGESSNKEKNWDDIPYCLFLAHRWIMDSSQLLSHFLTHFQDSRDTEERIRVCKAVATWIRQFPMHFDGQPQLCAFVVRLRTIAEEVPDSIRNSLDVSNLPSYAWMRNHSMRCRVVRQVSLSFDQWSPEDISTSLSHIDYKVLSRITIDELKKYIKEGNLQQTPLLERSISIFNNLTNWVQCMILSKLNPKERADIIIKFVNVGKHLRRLSNFNTLMAVIGGVTHSNIARLSKTHAYLPADIKKDLNSFTNLLSVQNNFGEYRKVLASCGGSSFKIPIVGVHLKDLIAANCVGQTFEKSKTISKRKLRQLAEILSNFLVCKQIPHHLPEANLDLVNTLKVSLDIRYKEEDIYELSQRREPKTFINFESNARPVVFADWASGVSAAPDPDTVNKHVSAMVDAVFKHYDHDRDGYISQAEFRQISGNFPFIEPFGTIDLDRDGQISKEELKAYFIKANKDSMAFRSGFKHDFYETTFLTPTTCGHCGKLLWGLIRQGWKCKDCGLSVHGYCKANAVAECRRRSSSSSGGLSDWLSPRHSSSFRDRLSLNYKRGTRFRTVSAVSSSVSPDLSTDTHTSSEINRLQLPHRCIRPQSETTDVYSTTLTPDDEPHVSLACEEVFEDDSVSTVD
ncbi:unnamed protein product [Auanema sp. JU1783]|nr:unnamed protein product [Auanema sp. JU1783]